MLNKLYRQMMFPESTLLFLIVLVFSSSTGSTEEFITIPKTEETKAEGSCVTISCTYKQISDSNVKLLWFKDPIYDHKIKEFTGTILYSNTDDHPQSPGYSSRVKYITDKGEETRNRQIKCDLKINDLQKTDSGNYSFRIIGSDTRNICKAMLLTVTENPCNVSIEPSEMKTSVKENEEFSVRCSTSASCPSYPEWFLQKPGQEPERVTLYRITQDEVKNEGKKITNLKLNPTWQDDNMTLFCHPANTQDSCLFRNISLSVEYGPKKVKATVSPGEIKKGGSVTLSCTSRGPNVTFSWFKQGIKKTQQSEWRLDNVKPEDSRDYYCEAENKHGKVQSNTIYISVKYGPKDVKVTSVFNISNLKEGDELKLECSVDSNPAPDQFYWYFNDSQLQKETSQILTISSVKPEHSGVYHCTAKNKIEAKQSENKVNVSVKYSPRPVQIEGGTSVKVNSKLTLTCSADANPPPNSYNWKHTSTSQSLPLSSSKTKVLTIDKVTIQHTGTYTCDVTNEIGTSSHFKNVTVLYPPSKPTLTMESEVREYELTIITCTVQSSPKSNLTVTGPFVFRNMPKHHMNRTESENMLRISLNVTKVDAGVYNCTATNSEGGNQSTQELKVLPSPNTGSHMVIQVIFIIILLLILITLAIFLIHRKMNKGSSNNSQENLATADAADASQGRTAELYSTLYSSDRVETQVSSARPASNTQQVYSEITLAQMKQRGPNPQKSEDNNSINYVTLDFKRHLEPPKRASKGQSSPIYTKVFKKKQPQKCSETELDDYENVSSACAPKLPIANMDWESDTSEEDDVKYTTVTVKPGLGKTRKKSSTSSTSSEEERTEYSAIKT